MVHALKTLPAFFEQILNGNKPFEIRYDDREFKLGDVLLLREIESSQPTVYTRRMLEVLVTYITDWEQKPGYVVMGIRILSRCTTGAWSNLCTGPKF
jgi:hypothetical protein